MNPSITSLLAIGEEVLDVEEGKNLAQVESYPREIYEVPNLEPFPMT